MHHIHVSPNQLQMIQMNGRRDKVLMVCLLTGSFHSIGTIAHNNTHHSNMMRAL
jgi:hypothetical protein